MEYVLQTFDICKSYKNKNVLNKVNMNIEKGDIYGFVGENGSGKTTIIRLITGLIHPNSGTFKLFGVDNTSSEIKQARSQIGAVVETPSIYKNMSAYENLKMQAEIIGGISEERIKEVIEEVGLGYVYNDKKHADDYSLGMRQRLGIAMCLLGDVKFIILDEPMNGLDPQGIVELRDLLIELNQKHGLTVLISSHILSELEKIASCYGFISHGQLVEEISVEELLARCEKSLVVKVEDVAHAEEVIKEMGVQKYKAFPNGDISIYDEIDIGETVSYLNKKKVKILSIKSIDESVEDYYLRLIRKGAK